MPAAQESATYLDLDEIEQPKVVIRHNGVEHELKQFTLADWIANTKEIQKMSAAGGDLEKESNVIITMISRSFPTLTPEILENMPLAKLNRILAYANGNNGVDAVNKEVQAQTRANPLSAPAEAPDITPKP